MKVDVWVLIAVGAVLTAALKSVGPLLLSGRTLPLTVRRALALLPPALVAALIAAGVWGTAGGAGAGPRAAGVAVGALIVLRRGPLLLAMVAAAAVAAGLRLLG